MPSDLQLRYAPLAPVGSTTFDPQTRSMRATIAAGGEVERWDARGRYVEALDPAGMVAPASVPLLNSHRRSDLGDVIGSATRIARAGILIEATLTLSRRDAVAPIADDIADGHIRGVSVGYRVLARREETDAAGGRRVTATRWEIAEVSIVPIPADPKAQIRSENPMPDPTITPAVTPAPVVVPPAPAPDTRAAVNAEIRSIASVAGLDQGWVDGQIDASATADAARAAAFQAMQARTTPLQTIRTAAPTITVDHNDPVAIRSAMSDALAHRLAPGRCAIEGRAREFAGHRVLDMVGDLAHARGDRVNLRDQNALMERAVGAHSTSDFPLLLADAANKSLLANYQAAAPTYRQWASRRSFNDFKAHNFLRIGDFPAMKEIKENGELKYGTISENREQVRAKEYGSGLVVGRRALINDDLSALADFSSMISVRTAADENRLVYSLLLSNPVLSDGVALFHVNHGNDAGVVGGSIGLATVIVGIAVASLRLQKLLDGLPLNLTPKFLIVGPELEQYARKLLAAVTATKAEDVNPWAGSMTLIVDGNIEDERWFIAADPAAAPSIVYGYVSGAEGPQIRTEIDFDTRAVKVAAGLDFGYGTIDFRGLVKGEGLFADD